MREARRLLRAIDTADAREMLARPDDVLFHDDLAPVNDPGLVPRFRRARRRGTACSISARRAARSARQRTEDEQYRDFVRMRVVPPVAALPRGGDA